MSQHIGIIPARYASTRFPGKPLALIGGITMIERVYRKAMQAQLHRVIVATDDERIADAVRAFGGEVAMTSTSIANGTDRCRAVVKQLNLQAGLVVNIQGDEPFIAPAQIDQVLELLKKPDAGIATLVSPALSLAEVNDPNRVKAVLDSEDRALYFSRLPIPYHRDAKNEGADPSGYYIHLGIYGFTIKTLLELEHLPPGRLEAAENLEQLRWREAGYHIHTATTPERADAVDTPEDLIAIEKKFFL